MRTPPKLAIPKSAELITAEVQKLLRAAGALGRIPTPRADILETLKLVEIGTLDLKEFEQSRIQRASETLHRAFSKIRGFFDRRTELIYVDPELQVSKHLFTTYHEVLHRILPWQKVQYTEDDEQTLSPNCKEVFESEANYGAAELLFQCEAFENDARDFELSVESARYLADRYGASYHSSLRRFVERNQKPCALLILKKTTRMNPCGRNSYHVTHTVQSTSFTLEFGLPFTSLFINPDEELGTIINSNSDGEIKLNDSKGFECAFIAELFSNQYHYFVMIYPKAAGRARKKVVRIMPSLGQTITMVERRGFLR